MKVLLAAPNDGHTNLYLERAFRKLGHEVVQWDYRQNPGGYDVSRTYDLRLVLKGEAFTPSFIKRLDCVLWNFDLWYRQEPSFIELAKAAKVFLTPAGGEVLEEFRAQGINAHYLPEAADPELHRPVYDATKIIDVSFIGTVKDVPGRDEWLAKVGRWCDENVKVFKIWGSFPGELSKKWHAGYRAGPSAPRLGTVSDMAGWALGMTEDQIHNNIVSQSRINLDRQRNPEIEGAVSARVFRTLAARGFLMARHSKGLEKLFNPGWDLLTYEDDDECIQILEAAFRETSNPFEPSFKTDHESERRVMGRHGWETVMNRHLFTHRVQELLKYVQS